jgi:Tfp pilus assembly protein PilN
MSQPSPRLIQSISAINLMAPRKVLRQQHQRRFRLLCLLAATGSALAICALQWLIQTRLQWQLQKNQQLQRQISQQPTSPLMLRTPLSTEDTLWLRHWLAQRDHAARLMQQLAALTPEAVALTHFRREGTRLTLSGQAHSATELRQLETALGRAPLWQKIKRVETSAAYYRQVPVLRFTLSSTLALPPLP